MSAPIPLRNDYTAIELREIAKRSQDAAQGRRLLSLAIIYDEGSRSHAAKNANVTLQVIRDWVIRFNAEGPKGLKDKKSAGPKPLLNEEQRAALIGMIEKGPIYAIHNVVRWRLCDLAQWIWEEYKISISTSALGRMLRKMGYRKLSARPCHRTQSKEAMSQFKKTSSPQWQKSEKTKHKEKR